MSLTYVNQVGAVQGINQTAPGAFISDMHVRWAQDILFDRAGYLRRRAPFGVFKLYNNDVPPVETYPSITNERIVNVISTLNPRGDRITGLVLSTSTSTRIVYYNENFRNTGSSTLSYVFNNDIIYDCKQASSGGMWLSFMESYKAASGSNEYYQYFWYGGHGTEEEVNNIVLGSKTVTSPSTHTTYTNTLTRSSGTFDTSKITPGMFVFVTYQSDRYYIGMVKEVNSGQVILDKDIIRFKPGTDISSASPSLLTGLTVKFYNVRPYIHAHGRGLITRSDVNATTVTSGSVGTEGEGHFAAAELGKWPTGTALAGTIRWALYRASDGEWIGDVDTTTNNAALSLAAAYHSKENNSALTAEEYIAWPYGSDERGITAVISPGDPTNFGGVFNATYAGLQWFGNAGDEENKHRIVFSGPHNAEAVDLSRDASDSIIIPATSEMRGLATSNTGLLIFTADKTYILRGSYRANFSLEELYPEGCLSAMSIVEYGGGVFWTSRVGMMFYDGASVRNLTSDNLGIYYTDSIRSFDVNSDRIYSFLHKDYLFVHFTAFNSVFKPFRYEPVYADGITTTPAISDFEANDWDPDFTTDDFLVENNVPIYWEPISLYDSTTTTTAKVVPFWQSGTSYPNATVTINSTTLGGLTLTSKSGTAATNDEITSNNHGLSNGTIVYFTTVVAGLTANTTPYYVVNATTNTFKVSTTLGGTPQDITASGSVTAVIVPGLNIIGNVSHIKPETTISQVTNTSTIVMSKTANATGSPITVQIIAAKTYQWGDIGVQYVWGPLRLSDGITFAIYLPTNAITTLSNFDFRGATKIDTISGIKALMGVNSVYATNNIRPRLIDVDTILEVDSKTSASEDEVLIENTGKSDNTYIKGPDFYLQTKHYTVGDPVLKKWFRLLMMSLYLLDGGLRMDIVDMEDNDRIDIQKKRHKNWEIFGEAGFSWTEFEGFVLPRILSPNRSTWKNTNDKNLSWYEIADAEFTRRKKKISWRYPSAGIRLYQMNKYRPSNYQTAQRPYKVIVDSWNLGFKPMRKSRV